MKKIIIIGSGLIILFTALLYSYSRWNAASPTKTCAGCHEITHAVDLWSGSTHRNIACKECHGTALSEGIHSLKEKGAMLLHHNSKIKTEDVRISEVQRLKVMERCEACHQTEYAKWNSGGHAMNYSEVFLNKTHNKTEVINEDCLRCHGMFFKGTVMDIVTPMDTLGPWKLKDASLADRPSIPCLACHQVHREGEPEVRQNREVPSSLHYTRIKNNLTAFYYRRDSNYFPVTSLVPQDINFQSVALKISTDPNQGLCLECHAPNAFRMSGTSDDRTPRGVHEGLSCMACHDSHSNSAINSCKTCHPAISNCKIDVEKMNTTYFDKSSKNNIHFVACTDCHIGGIPAKKSKL
jgi:hypothetical protein